MPLSIVQQRNIIIPSRLAEQIGLEAAVLLQTLSEYSLYAELRERNGLRWAQLSKGKLLALLPFWTENDVQRISDQLRERELIRLDSPQLALTDYYRFALNQATNPHSNNDIGHSLPSFHPRNHHSATAEVSRHPTPQGINIQQPQAHVSAHYTPPPSQQPPSQLNQSNHPRSIAPSWPTMGAKNKKQLITADWQPSENKTQQLITMHGIPIEFCQQQIGEFVSYWLDAAERVVSWDAKFHSHMIKEWQYQQVRKSQHQLKQQSKQEQKTAAASDLNDWQPSEEAADIMLRDGVDRDFIYNAVPEFILYWRERDSGAGQWNTKFIQHIRITWARYSATIDNDSLPQLIQTNWAPSADALDVLRMATIDPTFAESLVGEFVIFWRESQQPQRSWNSKFIQHVKYHWAKRHQLEAKNVGSQGHQHFTGKDQRGFVEKHTDTSWADDL